MGPTTVQGHRVLTIGEVRDIALALPEAYE